MAYLTLVISLAGGGAFEVAAAQHLRTVTRKSVSGRAKLGLDAFAEALCGLAKALAENSGHDPQEAILKLQVRPLLRQSAGLCVCVYEREVESAFRYVEG